MLTNDNFFQGVTGISDQWRFTDDSVNLAMMPMFHIAGAGWAMVGLYHGCRTVVLRDIDPAEILEVIAEFGVTNAFMVPAVIQFLLMTPGVESTDFSSLRTLVYGASPITDKVLIKGIETFGCEFIQVYGLTETTGAITQLDGADHDPENRPQLLRSCGRPYPWVEMRVVDGERQDVRPARSASCGRGRTRTWPATGTTRRRPPRPRPPTAGSAPATPATSTRTASSTCHDRVKDMIVTGGENVYPAEVENVLMRHPGVADVAVIGVPDEKWGEAVKAIVVPAPDSELAADDLEAAPSPSPASRSPATSCPSRSTSGGGAAPQPLGQAAQARAARALLGGRRPAPADPAGRRRPRPPGSRRAPSRRAW